MSFITRILLHENTEKIRYRMVRASLHVDYILLLLLLLTLFFGLTILYSASHENMAVVLKQMMHIVLAMGVMFLLAAIPPHKYKNWTPWVYGFSLILLILVMVMGKIGKGAQRWLDLGFMRFQPSELMKLALPMMMAWYFEQAQNPLPYKKLFMGALMISVPTLLIAKQPDLGTAIAVAIGGGCVLFLAGLSSYLMIGMALSIGAAAPLFGIFYDYQKQRILTLLNPESDPLGAGYHIIQSKIAIGSGGLMGKGWLQGSQAYLNFYLNIRLILFFSVNGEEFGCIGGVFLMILLLSVSLKGLSIALNAQTEYTRLLVASLTMSFSYRRLLIWAW